MSHSISGLRKASVVTAISCFAMALVAACDSTDGPVAKPGDGRVRLSAANSYTQLGNYVIHISAVPSVSITPEVASEYGITRSENQGLVNLVVLSRMNQVGMDMPIKADISSRAANLTGQLKEMVLKEVKEGTSIYYIGLVEVEDRETLNIDFDIRPEGGDRALLVRFSHEFYTR